MTDEQNKPVRSREAQEDSLAYHLGGLQSADKFRLLARAMIAEAEARGAAERRRKDGALTRAQHFLRDQAEAQDRLPERDDIKKWQEDQSEFFTADILEIVTEYAAWRDKKDGEGQEPVAWLIEDRMKGRPGCAHLVDRASTNRAFAEHMTTLNFDVSPLYTHPANVAALEGRIAELEKERDQYREGYQEMEALRKFYATDERHLKVVALAREILASDGTPS